MDIVDKDNVVLRKPERKYKLKKKYYLDWIRVIAVICVLYGHLVSVATFSTSLPTVIAQSNEINLPWIPANSHSLYKVDIFLGNCFHTSTAAIGVILFFWLAGFLTAMTREKYSGKEFIQRRLIRIYPGLIISVMFVGMVAWLSQGIIWPIHSYLFNATLIYPFMFCGATIGVLWTLGVEFIFDLIAIHVCKFTFRTILIINIVIGLLCIYHSIYYTEQLNYIIYFIKYIPIILFGATIYIATRAKNKLKAIGQLLIAFALSFIPLYIAIKSVYVSESSYASIGTLYRSDDYLDYVVFFRR